MLNSMKLWLCRFSSFIGLAGMCIVGLMVISLVIFLLYGVFSTVFPFIWNSIMDIVAGRIKLGWSSNWIDWILILSLPACLGIFLLMILVELTIQDYGWKGLWEGRLCGIEHKKGKK